MEGYGKRILVAEDDDHVRDVLASVLMQAGYSVHTVRDGQEALSEMKRRHFDVVLTDYHMPKFNGLEVLAYGQVLRPGTPVVILSAENSVVVKNALQQGAYAWLPKPYDPALLLDVVNEASHHVFKESA